MIALSFDVEEFDLPAEHGVKLPFETQINVWTSYLYPQKKLSNKINLAV